MLILTSLPLSPFPSRLPSPEERELSVFRYHTVKMKVKSLCRVRLFATPWTVAYWAPLSMGFSGQGDWSGLPFPSPGDLPNPGIEPRSPALQADTLPSEPLGRPLPYSRPKVNTDWVNRCKHQSWCVCVLAGVGVGHRVCLPWSPQVIQPC